MLRTLRMLCIFFAFLASPVVANAAPAPAPAAPPAMFTGMRYLENGRVRLGINLDLGGAVTFLADKKNGGKNIINSFDWGRQIQLSYYSGPIPYIGPNGEKPMKHWEGLGWNPIQSGDAGGNKSRTLFCERRGANAIFTRCVPLQWPHTTGVAGECEFETLYSLDGNVLTLEATIRNRRADKTQYHARVQEMPALYTNGPWFNLVTYLGDKPFTGAPVTRLVTKNNQRGWPWVHFYAPENWVALLDERGTGIGVFQPETMTFNAGFHPNDAKKGFGGEKDAQTGHIAPVGVHVLDHNIVWSYKTVFILGTLDDIRGYAEKHWKNRAPPRWNFKNSRHGWHFNGNMRDTGFPLNDALDLRFTKASALTGPVTFWKAEDAPVLEIEGAFSTASKTAHVTVAIQPVAKSDFTDWLNWSEGNASVEAEKREKAQKFPPAAEIRTTLPLRADGVLRTHKIRLSDLPKYNGAMKKLELHFYDTGSAKIKRISLKN
ncbi:MAG: hypothetical protein LBR07_04220 [Puniceicoccales bacterium]|nr:hypothetical protein [Puniceicoccales bacterium]